LTEKGFVQFAISGPNQYSGGRKEMLEEREDVDNEEDVD
jgi:hypothetical protein